MPICPRLAGLSGNTMAAASLGAPLASGYHAENFKVSMRYGPLQTETDCSTALQARTWKSPGRLSTLLTDTIGQLRFSRHCHSSRGAPFMFSVALFAALQSYACIALFQAGAMQRHCKLHSPLPGNRFMHKPSVPTATRQRWQATRIARVYQRWLVGNCGWRVMLQLGAVALQEQILEAPLQHP